MPPLAVKCIQSWEKYCPGYEIKRWDENNFDINYNTYTKEAYTAKKWAFVSDVARLWALVNYGGVYMDTDCELIKPIDNFLKHDAAAGFEPCSYVATAFLCAHKEHELFREVLDDYNEKTFVTKSGEYDLLTNVNRMAKILSKHGLLQNDMLQTVKGLTVYPSEYFNPKDWRTGEINITNNTHAIHHEDASWYNDKQRQSLRKRQRVNRLLGVKLGNVYLNCIRPFEGVWATIKNEGCKAVLIKIRKKLKKKTKTV